MKSRLGAPLVRLFPCPEGWRAQTASDSCSAASLSELCQKLPSGLKAELLLPSSSIVTEWMRLPAAPREDLLSMAQLQLEKLLPYTADDFVFDVEENGVDGEDAQILAVTAPLAEIKSVAEPLRSSGLGPVAVGVYALQLARALADKGVAMALWLEASQPFLLFSSGGKLLWVEGLAVSEDSALELGELQRGLLGAELSGVLPGPIQFANVGRSEWADLVREALPGGSVSVGDIEPAAEIVGNWLPPAWAEEASALVRKARLVGRIQWAAIGYAALLAVGFGWLAYEKSRIARMDREIAELQPQVDLIKSRQNRWRSMEAAVDPSRYLIELLHQTAKTVGPADIRITEFQVNPREFAFSAEASNVAEAIEYVGRLKKEPELASFKIESPNPNILPNERAQFRVTGKTDSALVKR